MIREGDDDPALFKALRLLCAALVLVAVIFATASCGTVIHEAAVMLAGELRQQ